MGGSRGAGCQVERPQPVTCAQSHGTPTARAVGTVGFEASRQQGGPKAGPG